MKNILSLLLFLSFNSYAVISSGEGINASEIIQLKDKSEKKKKCVTRKLNSNVKYADLTNTVSSNNKNSFLDDLKIENLTIGKRYEVSIHAYLVNIRVSQHELSLYNDNDNSNNFITKLRYYNNSSTFQHIEFEKIKEFTAQTDTLSVRYSINSGSVSVYTAANSEPQLVSNSTRIRICEADDREDIASF